LITKVKHSKGETVIRWRDVKAEETVEHEMTSCEEPRPELVDAIKQFIPYVIEICELPKSYAEKTTVTGISFTETTVDDMEVIGIVVTAQKKLTKTNGPMVINTPFLVDVGWPSYTQAAVEKSEEEAMRFRRGDRAQQPLPMRVAKKASGQ
jgi:hypothetical protein